MKSRHVALSRIGATVMLVWPLATYAQSSFQNLGFESGTFVPIPNDFWSRVYFDSAFPHWTGYIGTNLANAALYDRFFAGSSALGIFGTQSRPIEGNYTAVLQAGVDLFDGTTPLPVSLSQTGLVPIDANSLFFKASSWIAAPGGPNRLVVTLGGTTLSMAPVAVGTEGTYTLYGGDISSFAGQNLELRFTAVPLTDYTFYLDDIEFSPNPVPEPSTLALLGVAGVLGWLFWRRRNRGKLSSLP